MKPEEMSEESYKRYQSDGFTEDEIAEIWQHKLYFRARLAENNPDREITSSTYERAQKRLSKEVDTWMSGK